MIRLADHDGQTRLTGAGAVDAAAAALRLDLAEGRYAPGQRLVEAELVEDLGVGRGTVREALQRLATEGLITLVRNRGAVVRMLSRREAEEQYDIREMLEGLAAAGAARNIDRLGARERLKRILRAQDDGVDFARVNREFHAAIMALAGNDQLQRLLEHLNLQLFAVQFRTHVGPRSWVVSAEDHARIAAAIMAGNPAAAQRAMRRHIRNGRHMILGLPDRAFRAVREGGG